VNGKPEETSEQIYQRSAPHVIDLTDPALGEDANEFQGYHY
jgi:hypothetical protein